MKIFTEFYNAMAYLIRILLDQADEKFFEKYSAISYNQKVKMDRELEERLPELFHEKRIVEVTSSDQYDTSFFQRLNFSGKT